MAEETDARLGATEAAEFLGIHRDTLWSVPREHLAYVTTPGGSERAGHRRYMRSDLQAYGENFLGWTHDN